MVAVHTDQSWAGVNNLSCSWDSSVSEGAVFARRNIDTGRNTKENPMVEHLPPHPTTPQRERGAATAEYAIATMAAVGFAGLLVVIMRSDEVRQILTDLVRSALTFAG